MAKNKYSSVDLNRVMWDFSCAITSRLNKRATEHGLDYRWRTVDYVLYEPTVCSGISVIDLFPLGINDAVDLVWEDSLGAL
ncbi:hypothetical protein [Enterococcus sp. AD013-P3]|uniref:hypothetical protein n=1 Tax=Enterococcus sp. AD013-P3 TaxID=3411036 RepID=UPI003B939765